MRNRALLRQCWVGQSRGNRLLRCRRSPRCRGEPGVGIPLNAVSPNALLALVCEHDLCLAY